MAERPAKHWSSSSKPPIRKRPTSAPQKKVNEKPPTLTKQTATFVRPRPVSPLEDATDLLLVSPIRVLSPKASRATSGEGSRQSTPKKVTLVEDTTEISQLTTLEIKNNSRESVGEKQSQTALWRNPSDNKVNQVQEDIEINEAHDQVGELVNNTIAEDQIEPSPVEEGKELEAKEESSEELSEENNMNSIAMRKGSLASTYVLNPNRSDLGKVLPSLKRPPGILRTGTIRQTSVSNRPAWGARPAVKLVSKARWIIPKKKQSISLHNPEATYLPKPTEEAANEENAKWIDDNSIDSDDAQSSESEAEKDDEINIEFQDSAIPPPEPQKLESGSQTPRKLERKKSHVVAKPNPLLKMSTSQYNLFSNTAGTFRGPGDPYFAFVLGGKSVRPGAKRFKAVKLSEINEGKADEILIDKNANRFNTSSWNYRALTRLRKRYKDVVSDEIDKKVGSLEETRAYEAENQELKKEYGEVLADINVRVSDTLKKNADFINQIKGLQKKGMQERKDLVKEFGNALKKWEEEEKAHLRKIQDLNSIYNAKCADLEDLKLFAKETFEDPTISAKRIEFELGRKNDHLKDLQAKLEANKNQFDHLQDDLDSKATEKGALIIEKAANKFESYINTNTKTALFKNAHLKSEIARQKMYIGGIEIEIEKLKKEKIILKQEQPEYFDDRRKVLKLKDCMTCTPDMDIELSPYKKLPMIKSQQ